MARLNGDAREILCNMVTEKAEAKLKKLTEDLDVIDTEIAASYKKRVLAARRDIEGVLPQFRLEVDRILNKHKLGWMIDYGDKRYSLRDILDECGGLKDNLRKYIANEEKKPSRKSQVETQLEDLDAKVVKAKREILLRAALGMKYDEIVAIVNGFQF